MKFCPKCGSLLTPKKVDGEKVLYCRSCDEYQEIGDSGKDYVISDEFENKDGDENVVLVKDEIVPFPVTKATCKKCGNTRAYYYSVQTRGGDEAETVYLTCTKCKHVWKQTS
jgi:DNA-directed RNA polymerase subunit M